MEFPLLSGSFAVYTQRIQKSGRRNCRFYCMQDQTARSTLLERRHLVQAYTWHGVPLTTALTRFTLGFHARLERLWEWETLMPKVTPLPQKSHLAILCTSYHMRILNYPHLLRTLKYNTKLRRKMQVFFYLFFVFRKNLLLFFSRDGIISKMLPRGLRKWSCTAFRFPSW